MGVLTYELIIHLHVKLSVLSVLLELDSGCCIR